MTWTKYMLIAVALILVIGGAAAYLKLKAVGFFPRADYDTLAPIIPSFDRPAILVLNKVNGFIHVDALPAADAMLSTIARQRGWDIFITDNAASHNPDDLKKFQAIVWNNVSGDVLTTEQRAALKGWIEQGGGWVGLHAAGGDFSYQWDWYVQTLIGAQFVGHSMRPQFQDADVLVADGGVEVTAHLPDRWTVHNEEWYAFDRIPGDGDYEVLLTLDEASYNTRGKTFMGQDRMAGEHPITWRHHLGQGRVFYSAIGHQAATYSLPEYQQLIANAIAWSMTP